MVIYINDDEIQQALDECIETNDPKAFIWIISKTNGLMNAVRAPLCKCGSVPKLTVIAGSIHKYCPECKAFFM